MATLGARLGGYLTCDLAWRGGKEAWETRKVMVRKPSEGGECRGVEEVDPFG